MGLVTSYKRLLKCSQGLSSWLWAPHKWEPQQPGTWLLQDACCDIHMQPFGHTMQLYIYKFQVFKVVTANWGFQASQQVVNKFTPANTMSVEARVLETGGPSGPQGLTVESACLATQGLRVLATAQQLNAKAYTVRDKHDEQWSSKPNSMDKDAVH